MNPIKIAEDDKWQIFWEDPFVQEMPSYPVEGSVQWVNDVLVVKLGNRE